MVPRCISFLFIMLAEHFSARCSAQIQFMKLQIELLRQKLGGNQVIPERGKEQVAPEDTEPLGKVGCQKWLGGVLKHYYRKAA